MYTPNPVPEDSGDLRRFINDELQKLRDEIEYVRESTEMNDYWLKHAVNVIASNYGDTVSVDKKNKDLIKFGEHSMNSNTNFQTVETKPHTSIDNETYATSNSIDYIVSSATTDSAANNNSDGVLEGHTIDGSGNFTFVSQAVTLNGQTPVALSTPIARATRWYNTDSAEATGKISIYDSGTTTITSGAPSAGYTGVHLTIPAGSQNSEKCSTTISNDDYFIVTGIYADVLSKSAEDIELEFQVRQKGGVFRRAFKFSAKDGQGTFRTAAPYAIVPKNADVRIRAKCDGSFTGSLIVGAGMFGALAKII